MAIRQELSYLLQIEEEIGFPASATGNDEETNHNSPFSGFSILT